jgi:LuxR family maltose regulon positive regulatory protein
VDDTLTYLREFEHLTLAKVRAADEARRGRRGDLAPTLSFLDRLLDAATEGVRAGSVIEIQLTRALVLQQAGAHDEALASLGTALELAEPQDYARTFVGEGRPMATLLAAEEKRSPAAYVSHLLAACGPVPVRGTSSTPRPAGSNHGTPIEALSSRERDVLRLLGTELSGPEIARELVVSLNTVRTHTKNVYMKLGVSSRRSAVVRGKELDLL